MTSRKGFTLVELMVVILIVGILAAVAIPLMQGRIEKAKWSEANAAAGTIRTAIRAYVAETSVATAKTNLNGTNLGTAGIRALLGFGETDLDGTYFAPGNYAIGTLNDQGFAPITVSGQNKTDAPSGSYQLTAAGAWVKQS